MRCISSPRDFINPVPHLSFVRGSKNIDYLKRRFDALKTHHAFADMEYSEDRATLSEWMPLMMPGRDPSEPIAATRAMNGTDVNFGAVTSQLLGYLTHLFHLVPVDNVRNAGKVTLANLPSRSCSPSATVPAW